jgi:hypothetical protein
MKKLLTAIALTIALPAVAHAQAVPAPAPKADCCEKMKAEGKECACCKEMDHSKMDHSKMDQSQHGAGATAADSHAGHQK